jgi:hypothetical protein
LAEKAELSNESQVKSLLAGREFKDNRLYTLLSLLSNDLYTLNSQVNPPEAQDVAFTGQILFPSNPGTLGLEIFPNNVRLTWPSVGFGVTYEIRHFSGSGSGSVWDTSTVILRTTSLQIDINPTSIPLSIGSHTFLIKSLDKDGNYSETASFVEMTVPRIPASDLTAIVVSNFILLYWSTPSSVFSIDRYNIYKNGAFQGDMRGTFESIFEIVGGTYSYSVEAVDIVGNIGVPSTAAVVQVSNPADFAFHNRIASIFSGTKINCVSELSGVSNDYLLAMVNATETYQQHFDSRGWSSPQDQVNAGYPIVAEPSKTTGSYQEVFDFGSIVSNIIATVAWNTITIAGSVIVSPVLETSTDAITWSTPSSSLSLFAASARYVRFTMNFSGSGDRNLSYFFNLECIFNVRREVDSGVIHAVSTDVGGTTVTMNKIFKSVDSITLTPNISGGTTQRVAVFDFNFATINPTTFKVYLFDNTGARLTGDVAWAVRGVI